MHVVCAVQLFPRSDGVPQECVAIFALENSA
jgi:hypothetical protein